MRVITLVLMTSLGACRLDLQRIEVGPTIDVAAYDALAPGRDDRGSILTALGPPQNVWYTLDEEVLEYRQGGHRGTNLTFLLSNSDGVLTVFGGARLLADQFIPLEQPAEFDRRSTEAQATSSAQSASVPVAVTEMMALLNRRLRYDVVLLQLDRDTLRLKRKQVLLAVPASSAGEAARSSFLMNEG